MKNRRDTHGYLNDSSTPWLVRYYDIFSDGKEIEIPVSFLTDAIYEIANKTSSLVKDINGVIITMQTEPGEFRFNILKISKLLCLFKVYE